jgi:hypothetical protein
MKTFQVEITGINPLLIHRFAGEPEGSSRKAKVESAPDTRVIAEKAANIAPDGTHYISAFALVNAMTAAGSNHKMRGTRKSVRFIVPSAVRVVSSDATCIILVDGRPAKTFEVDARPVTIPATKGRIMRYRPRYERWSMRFELQVEDDLIDPTLVHQLLTEAGVQVGVDDFRPEKRGPFGTFRVTSWQEVREPVLVAAE